MGTRLFPAQRPPVVLTDSPQERDLVLPLASPRQQRPAAEIAGTGDGSAALRLCALEHPARTGALARRPQPCASALQAGGTPGSYESASAQAHHAYDYHEYHRQRLHWIGGDVAFSRDLETGTHDEFTRPGATPDRYFEDLVSCFAEWARVLRRRGKCSLDTGTEDNPEGV